MALISVFSGTFCHELPVIQALVGRTGYQAVDDADLIRAAAGLSPIPESKIERVFSAHPSEFNKITHEREQSIACLRLAAARIQSDDKMVISGFAAQLIPRDIRHVLRVCLISDMKSRLAAAVSQLQVPEAEAAKRIHKQDHDRAAWMRDVFNRADPWDASLYDMVFPTDKVAVASIVSTIAEVAQSPVAARTKHSQKSARDFLLAAEVDLALLKEGHHVTVQADAGAVCLIIDKHVLMLGRLENELKAIVGKVGGVETVTTIAGPGFHALDAFRGQEAGMPSKILLVDDEREYVQTLSERLHLRDMGSSVAYDGESALEAVREDEPDVMILDLKMPGIDGIEVLRRVKETQPQVEVIILTGHGSEADKQVCMQLGAFAYLHKPVDVEELSATIKRANAKLEAIRAAKK